MAQDEDCLHLNVWTADPDGRAPVLVWIHGGNFTWGSTADPVTWGDRLAAPGDCVVVSVGHRLGVLGFLGDANLGLLDLVAALEWVRDEIAGFGGDPGNVTVFGMSSGGMKIAALHAMPAAQGLFHRAVSQSGPGLRALQPEVADRFEAAFLAALGDDPRRAPVEELLRAQDDVSRVNPVDAGVALGPVLGPALPIHPVDAAPTVPWLVGTNRDELALLVRDDPRYASYAGVTTDDEALACLARLTPEAGRLLGAFREHRPASSPADLLVAVLSERMRTSAMVLAERMGAFAYRFDFRSPVTGSSFHGLEVPFVFDCVDRDPRTGGGPDAVAVAAAMRSAWVAFARDGDPGWPRYDDVDRATMCFDVEPRVVLDPDGAERRIVTELGLAW